MGCNKRLEPVVPPIKRSKLMNDQLAGRMPSLRTKVTDKSIIQIHYFNPVGRGDWYAITYSPKERMFFGYVSIFKDHNDELGYFSLDELESIELHWGRKIERDTYWHERTLGDIKKEIEG